MPDFRSLSLKERRDKIRAMSKEELIDWVDSSPTLKVRVDARSPSEWREDPHHFWTRILAVTNTAHLNDEEYIDYQRFGKATLNIR